MCELLTTCFIRCKVADLHTVTPVSILVKQKQYSYRCINYADHETSNCDTHEVEFVSHVHDTYHPCNFQQTHVHQSKFKCREWNDPCSSSSPSQCCNR